MSVAVTQHRLGRALAAYLVVLIGVVTLVPFRFHWPVAFHLTGFTTVGDLVENVALFVPLGFFIAFSRRGHPVLVGFLLSLGVESLQQFIPGRFSSPLDLLTNLAGAWLGGWCFRWAAESISSRQCEIGVMALDLPLMGLVYLLLPLLWLSGLAAGGDPGRGWLVALPGITMAVVIASVGRHALAPRGVLPVVTALAAGVAMMHGLIPGWFADPLFVVAASGLLVAAVMVFGELLTRGEPQGRRFELPTVERALVPFGVYLLFVALWPFPFEVAAWRGTVAFGASVERLGQVGILRMLELLAGATFVGYAFAELRGRQDESTLRQRMVALATGLAVAGVLVVVRGWHPRYGASLVEAVLLVLATGFGAVLYWRHRAYVQAVLGVGSERPGSA